MYSLINSSKFIQLWKHGHNPVFNIFVMILLIHFCNPVLEYFITSKSSLMPICSQSLLPVWSAPITLQLYLYSFAISRNRYYFLIYNLQIRKISCRGLKWRAQDHKANKWPAFISSQSDPRVFTIMLYCCKKQYEKSEEFRSGRDHIWL